MAHVHAMPVSIPRPSPSPSHDDVRPHVPVVILDETMPAAGFLVLRSAVAALLRSSTRTLVVDVSALERLSSSTVSALLWAQRRCRLSGGSIVLRGVSRRTRKTLRRTGLWQVFEIEPRAGNTEPRMESR